MIELRRIIVIHDLKRQGLSISEIGRRAPETRLIVIEDSPEIRHPLADHVAMRTSDTVGMDDLLVDTLRHAPPASWWARCGPVRC